MEVFKYFLILAIFFIVRPVFAVEPIQYTQPITGGNKFCINGTNTACRDSFSSSFAAFIVSGSTQQLCSVVWQSRGSYYDTYRLYWKSTPAGSCGSYYTGYLLDGACSAGSTLEASTAQCKLTTPTCPNSYLYQNGTCVANVQDCPSGQYKDSSSNCVPITTDCNLDIAGGGNFFNTATASCQSVTPLVICVAKDSNNAAGNNTVYCPPISDCIAPGQMCSDNQIDVQAKADMRAAEVAAAKVKADTAAAEAAQAKADKDAAKAAKDAAATASAAQAAAAQAAAQAAAAQGTTSITAIQAAQAAAQAAQRQAADAIAAANAAAQGLIVDIQEAIAGNRQGQINAGQGSLGGNMAGDLGQQAEKAAEKAKAAAWGAQGGYAPDGQPSAGETGIPQQTDCPDCAKEGTLQGIKNDLEKAENDYSGEPAGTASIEASNTKLVNALKGHFTLPNIGPIAADCPVFTKDIPFINVTLTIDQFCTMEPMIRPYIEGAVTVMYSIMGLFIVLGA